MGRTSDAKNRIIAAATELLWRQSLGTVSVDAICDAAGVQKGSFYHFFSSKDDLVLAALNQHWDARKPSLDLHFSAENPPLDRLRAYFKSVSERQRQLKRKYGRYLGCFYCAVGMDNSSEVVRRRVAQIMAHYTQYYRGALQDAHEQKLIAVADVARTADSLFAYMQGVLTQSRIRNDDSLISNLSRSAMAFINATDNEKPLERDAQ